MRRILLYVVVVLAGTWMAGAQAQDPRGTVVHAAAMAWLAQADKFDAQGTWNAAGEKFQKQMSAQQWGTALHSAREPLGAVTQRALVATSFATQMPGAPDGDYAQLQFRTAFANKTEAHESVTLEHQPDGQWRVIGYFIR